MFPTPVAAALRVHDDPRHLHVDVLSAPWLQALSEQADRFGPYRSVSVGYVPRRLRSAAAPLQPPLPLGHITRISAVRPYPLLRRLCVGVQSDNVVAAHIANAAVVPNARATDEPSDALRLFALHPNLCVASFCRQILRVQDVQRAIDRDLRAASPRRGGAAPVPRAGRAAVLWETLCMDIARTVHRLGKEVEQSAPRSLTHVSVLFDSTGIEHFTMFVRQALCTPLDPQDAETPVLAEWLAKMPSPAAAQGQITWEFAFGTPQGPPPQILRLVGSHRQQLALRVVGATASAPNPFVWSTLASEHGQAEG